MGGGEGGNYSQGFSQGTGKIVIVWDVFWENGDEDLVLSPFSHCKLNYLEPTYYTMYINFIMFSLKQEKPNETLLPLYIFLNAMPLNLKGKGQFDMSN